MKLTGTLSASWRRFLGATGSQDRRRLIELLRDEYMKEAKDVAQFQEHADRMTYPHFRKRLLDIAEEEKAHVEWLRDKIRALGGELPEMRLPVTSGRNNWECLLADVEEERRDSSAVLARIYTLAEEADSEITEGLRRMHEDEKRHRQEILDMLMKSDPQAQLS